MITAVFDGSLESLLKIAAYINRYKIPFDEVSTSENRESLFAQNIYADENIEVDMRAVDMEQLKLLFLANDKNLYKIIVSHYIQSVNDSQSIEINAKIDNLIKSVTKEAHRYKGFIRFELTEMGFFARISPKNDVLPLIAPHFQQRFKDDRVIFDENRQVAAVISDKGFRLIEAKVDSFRKQAKEARFEGLWRRFFDSVAISERQNEKAQRCFVPLRYRSFMSEFL